MAYSKQTWADGVVGATPITAARLGHIEDGVAAAAVAADIPTAGTATGDALRAAFDAAGAAATAQGASLQKTSNLSDLPSAPTARTNLGLGSAATQPTSAFDAAGAAALRAPLLTPTAAKTAAYTAAVSDLAMMNVPGGGATLTLPTAPADKAQVGYRAIGATTAAPLTVNRGGTTDTIGTAGATSATLPMADEVVVLQYDAPNARWLAISAVKTQASLDARYGGLAADNTWTGKQSFSGAIQVTDPWLDVRSRGATGTNATADTAAIQQAFTDVRNAGGGTVLIPKIYTTNSPLILAGSGVHVVGNSRENCGIQNSTTDVIQLGDSTTSFAQSSIERLKLRALTGGGHVFIQGRNTSQTDFLQLDMYQDNDAKSIFESAGLNLLETFWRSCFAQHRLTATVPGFNLVASNGGLNRNTWQQMRVLNSGNYMWHVEETSANYCRDNVWRDINAEVCNGGVIALYSPRGGVIEHVSCYDLTTTTKDLFLVTKSTGNIGFARFRDIHRPPGGSLGSSLVDLRLANSSTAVVDGWTNATLDLNFARAVLRDLDTVTLQNAGNVIEFYNRGPVFRSPDGTRYIITVANGGAVSTTVAP